MTAPKSAARRYEGLNGTLVVDTETVTVERDATLAANNGLHQRWVIPLARVTGADLSPLDGSDSWYRLSIEVDGKLAPPPTREAVRFDPNCVTFFDRDIVAPLHEWLLEVSAHNRQLTAGSSSLSHEGARGGGLTLPPALDPDRVFPADPVVEVECVGPDGWPDTPRGWRPEIGQFLNGDEEAVLRHPFWRITAPEEVAAEVAQADFGLPDEWQETGAPSDEAWLQWACATVEGRLHVLNDFELRIAHNLERAADWADDEAVPQIGVRVPEDHPTIERRATAWNQLMTGCVAARDWALWTLLTGSNATPELLGWHQALMGLQRASWDASGAVRELRDELRDRRLALMSPEQQHRFWWGGSSGPLDEAEWQQAERLAESALQQIGFTDAERTPAGTDKGLDVVGATVAAQVKYTGTPVGRPLLQQLRGAADGRITVFFSRAGYTAAALDYAEESSMALFTMALPSRISAISSLAKDMAQNMT